MSRPIEPCNCSQAQCYEGLLQALVDAVKFALDTPHAVKLLRAPLINAQTVLATYKKATAEYEQEG